MMTSTGWRRDQATWILAEPSRGVVKRAPGTVAGEHVRAWLEFLPHDNIRDWADLKRVFVGNFQGTCVRLGNS